jgi:hypothetical protein
MQKNSEKGNNFADALQREDQYAVLTKTGRIQILVQPAATGLRKRGKRGWQLFGTVASGPDAVQTLLDTIKKALLEAEGADTPAAQDGKNVKASKTKSKHL